MSSVKTVDPHTKWFMDLGDRLMNILIKLREDRAFVSYRRTHNLALAEKEKALRKKHAKAKPQTD